MEDLLVGLREGDSRSWETLYNAYGPGLLRFMGAMVGDSGIAEELVQEGFYRLLTHLGELENGDALKSWLYTTCRRLAIDWSRKRRPALLGYESEDSHMLLEQVDTTQMLKQAVLSLSDAQKEVVLLRIWEDLSYPEISRITGLSEGTLRSQFHWAMRRLRKELEHNPSGEKEEEM